MQIGERAREQESASKREGGGEREEVLKSRA